MDAADPTFPPEDATERAHRDDFKRDYGLDRWADLSTDDFERFMRECEQ